MGCFNSNTVNTNVIKLNDPNKAHEKSFKTNIITLKPPADKMENQDILDKLLSKSKFKDFINKILILNQITPEIENESEGLFNLIKPEFEELFKRFNISYEFPSKNFDVDLKSFKLECSPSSINDLDFYMPLFLFEILLYPKSFIKNSKINSFTFINSLNFVTPDYQQYRAACPEYYKTKSLYLCTKERSPVYIRTVIHHEFFHYVDFIDDGTYDEPKWNKLNYPGFKYGKGGAYEREWKPLDPETKGFINFYSTTGIEEDKAEVFQYLMSFPEEAFANKDPIINNKIYYMANFLRDFDTDGMGLPENDFFTNLTKHRKTFKLN